MITVKTRLKSFLLSILSKRVPWGKLAFSQFGEDVALLSTLNYCELRNGFYLDIGAFHPVQLSNTFALYQAGWRGITVEPNSAYTSLFHVMRPLDTHLTCVVSPTDIVEPIPFYSFGDNSVYNTLSKEAADKTAEWLGSYSIINVPSRTINSILSEHLAPDRTLDLLCLDCEGFDEFLLQSLDWTRYRPSAIVFEYDGAIKQALTLPITKLLDSMGYFIFAKIGPSIIARLSRDEILKRVRH